LVVPKSRPTASTLAAARALEPSCIMGFTIKARETLVNVERRAYTRQTLRMTIALRALIRKTRSFSGRDFPRPYFFQSRIAQEGKNAAANSRV
jgi:hypothetical protein